MFVFGNFFILYVRTSKVVVVHYTTIVIREFSIL